MSHQYWFKPKTFGYGATPNTREGWLTVAVYVLVIAACAVPTVLQKGSAPILVSSLAVIAVATILLFVVTAQKTDGSWRWRWGANNISGKND